MTIDGLRYGWIAEVSIGSPPTIGIVAHELSHLLLGLPDRYYTFFTPTAPGQYSIMDQHPPGGHIDITHKRELGWADVTRVTTTARRTLEAVETSNRCWMLLDPDRGEDEYFLVENRSGKDNFDSSLFDSGLTIWHVMEDAEVYDRAAPPPNVNPTDWCDLGSHNFPRKGIRMIRPLQAEPFDDTIALWDGSDPVTGYDLASHSMPPHDKTVLRWGDGSPSSFRITGLSPAASTMSALIEVVRWSHNIELQDHSSKAPPALAALGGDVHMVHLGVLS